MRYEDVIEDVYQYFLEKGLRTCRNNHVGYHMKRDKQTGRHYFRNEDNPNQIVIGSMKTKNSSTFMCIGIINIEGLIVNKEIFFCKIVESLLNESQINNYYIEQGFMKLKEENQKGSSEYQISTEILKLLKQRSQKLYELFVDYDMYNLPSTLELSEKYIIKGMMLLNGKTTQKLEEKNLSDECELTPLNDYEKDIIELINRKTEEEKMLLECAAQEYTGKTYILK